MLHSLLITWVLSHGGGGPGELQVLCEAVHVAEVCDLAVTVITTSPHHPYNLDGQWFHKYPKTHQKTHQLRAGEELK